tara:strand:- start:1901 stop:2482 length:582 start_codon:yes stop_codon:yes gene_type:complete
MVKKTAPTPEVIAQEIEAVTTLDIPEHLQTYNSRIEMARDEYANDIKEAIYSVLDAITEAHPFIQEKVLNSLCWAAHRQPDYLSSEIQKAVRERDGKFRSSNRGEIDQLNADSKTEYIERLGEDLIIWTMLQTELVTMFNEHTSTHNRPKWGEKKVAGGPTVSYKVITDLAATYGVVAKTTEEQIAEAEQVAA